MVYNAHLVTWNLHANFFLLFRLKGLAVLPRHTYTRTYKNTSKPKCLLYTLVLVLVHLCVCVCVHVGGVGACGWEGSGCVHVSQPNPPTKGTEFGMWSPSNWVSIINHMCVVMGVVSVIAMHTENCLGCQKLIEIPILPKLMCGLQVP